ncbi:MAG: hypothetical protein ACR2MW_07450 [Chthoniobacterales bacterium]
MKAMNGDDPAKTSVVRAELAELQRPIEQTLHTTRITVTGDRNSASDDAAVWADFDL